MLFNGKKPKTTEEDQINKATLIKLLSGGKVKPAELLCNESFTEVGSISLGMKDEEFNAVITELGDDAQLIILAKQLYDWSILADLLDTGSENGGEKYISNAKVKVYEQHQKDLKFLKYFVKKYISDKYDDIFRSDSVKNNYVWYSYNLKNVNNKIKIEKKAKKEDFSDFLLKLVRCVEVDETDAVKYEDMINRLTSYSFLPKQVDGDNRVIPYQLYYAQLKRILQNTINYLPFLSEQDEDGLTIYQKIISVFMFRIPYYVGPLNAHSDNAWIKRKAQGKIYPWNFDKVVDLDASEQEFIKRMTNTCTYLPTENVIAKNSLLYCKFVTLNEINNIKVGGEKITVECKQGIFNNLFMKKARVNKRDIVNYLKSCGVECTMDNLEGLNQNVQSSLKSYVFFKPFIEQGDLTYNQVEKILEIKAYSEDNNRFAKWLKENYSNLPEKTCKIIAKQNFKEFGRISKAFLTEVYGINKETGERANIIDALWQTNNNLMQLLSEKYTFLDEIEQIKQEYYANNPLDLSSRLDEMYISNSVKRPIIRTFDILNDIIKINKGAPKKIFVEMARGEEEKKVTKSRREQILEFYKGLNNSDEINLLKSQLERKDDRELRSDKLYLYFIQLGKCMYSGQAIDIEQLATTTYNIDHIYPQSKVKDDSLTNKVLVLSTINGEKENVIPIKREIRDKMYSFWKMLNENNFISDEKFRRLTRSTPFSADEKWGFINRQLVETRQSTKAVATLLQEILPNTEIVYVKARLASEFRQEIEMLKSRSVNDLHHAKDAYLNIVVGNVYNLLYTRQWFLQHQEEYSINFKFTFGCEHTVRGEKIWFGGRSIAFVKSVLCKNNIHLTRYAFCRRGGFFDQMPLKAGANDTLVERKKGLNSSTYGGYNKTTATFFALVKFEAGKKKDIMFMPVELLYAQKYLNDQDFAINYAKDTIGKINNCVVTSVTFPLKQQIIKINTVLSLDGFLFTLSGKANGGKGLLIRSNISFICDNEYEQYVKRIESFTEKQKTNANLHVDEKHDKLCKEQNLKLYDLYLDKIKSKTFYKAIGTSVAQVIENGRDIFINLTIEEQLKTLLNIGLIFKTGRAGGVDLSAINGASKAGELRLSTLLSNLKKKCSDVRIINQSASGLYQSSTCNLFDLL